MSRFARIWSGRPSGLPAALVTGCAVAMRRLLDALSTALARGNLGELGPGSRIQAGATIRHPGQVRIGAGTSIATGTEIASEMPDSACWIGSAVIVGSGVRLDYSGGLVIEDDVVLSEGVFVYTHSHGLAPKSAPNRTPLVIERGAWIGSHAIVIEGTTRIGAGSVVAAGSVVTREIPPGVVAGGVPARVIKSIE